MMRLLLRVVPSLLLRGITSLLRGVTSLLRRVVATLRGRLLAVAHLRAGLVVVALGRGRAVRGGAARRVRASAVSGLGVLGLAAVLGGLVVLGHGDDATRASM